MIYDLNILLRYMYVNLCTSYKQSCFNDFLKNHIDI